MKASAKEGRIQNRLWAFSCVFKEAEAAGWRQSWLMARFVAAKGTKGKNDSDQ
jgi:hypothetical protein